MRVKLLKAQQEAQHWAGHHSRRQNMPMSLKNVLDEALKLITFTESQPLSTRLFNILCDGPGNARGLVTGK